MYLTATRPDIAYETSYISKFSESPKVFHWKVGKRILRYIEGTTTYGFWYTTSVDSTPMGYIESGFSSNIDDRKSTS